MTFLGLIGLPPVDFTYPEYQALKAATPEIAPILAAAEEAAIGSLLVEGAAVFGAGFAGVALGMWIRGQLGLDRDPGPLSNWVSGGSDGEHYLVYFTFFSPPAAPTSTNVEIVGRFAGPLRKTDAPNEDVFFIRQINPAADVNLVSFGPSSNPNARINITNVTTLAGNPAPNLKNVPVLPQQPQYVPYKVPVVVPATPYFPSFPITPYVVPTPGNDPDEDQKAIGPGVTVKIPEVGLQTQYGPNGVRISGYRDPDTVPYMPPKIFVPPTVLPPAAPVCPCPETDLTEVVCRLKRLETDLLNNGYDLDFINFSAAQSNRIDLDYRDGFIVVVNLVTIPVNGKRQYYPEPAVNVEYGGWFAFIFGSTVGDRQPIDKASCVYEAPLFATGFVVACNYGYEASGYAQRKTKKAYVDNCS